MQIIFIFLLHVNNCTEIFFKVKYIIWKLIMFTNIGLILAL